MIFFHDDGNIELPNRKLPTHHIVTIALQCFNCGTVFQNVVSEGESIVPACPHGCDSDFLCEEVSPIETVTKER